MVAGGGGDLGGLCWNGFRIDLEISFGFVGFRLVGVGIGGSWWRRVSYVYGKRPRYTASGHGELWNGGSSFSF